jgi:hypothetical protein
MIFDAFAAARFGYASGANGTVAIPSGYVVTGIFAAASAAATLTITPGGAGQTATAGDAITVPTSGGLRLEGPIVWPLGAGTSLVFATTTSYLVTYAKFGGA